MKLSAPPPPPPEPPEPGSTPEPNRGGESAATGGGGEAASTTSPSPGPATHAPPVTATRQATWPAWFAGVDVVLVVLAVALGFLLASFTAYNSDVWLHLGIGKMLTTGEYKLGSDPLSYSAADRPWVNHHWLYDLGTYLIYRIDGSALVFLKALVVAAAMGLLIGMRRPGQSLLPWAVLVGIAAIAAAPRFTLQPLVGSIFFLALTLFLVSRLNRPRSWRLAAAIGVTFWLWANVDTWFILGPIALGLLLIGEIVRTRVLSLPPSLPGDDPLGPLPDLSTLARALLIGIVVCMLNPHHVRVWQIPFELAPVDVVETEPTFQLIRLTPLTSLYRTDEHLGYNRNGLAYATLLLAGLGTVVVCVVRLIGQLRGPRSEVRPVSVPLSYSILWCAFAALSLRSAFAIPFLAVVTVPLVASQFNLLSAQVPLGTWADRRTRLLLTVVGAGRMALVVVFLTLAATAWTGWLQPVIVNPAFIRRVSWELESDLALVEAAKQIQSWRESGELPPEARGLITSVDLANYCALYAPAEKVFLNGRYNHHRLEIPDFVTVRVALNLVTTEEGAAPGGQEPARKVMNAWKGSYLVVASSVGERQHNRGQAAKVIFQLGLAWQRCSTWFLNGRVGVFGWRAAPGTGEPSFDRLGIDPGRLAFGPNVERLPAGKAVPIPPPADWTDDFVRPPPRPAGPGVDEAITWLQFKQIYAFRQGNKTAYTAILMHQLAPRMFGFPGAELGAANILSRPPQPNVNPSGPWPPAGATLAAPILALRAVRRAIAANPDHPDGYFALSRVLQDPDLPIPDAERGLAVLTALRQCLSRLPPPAQWKPGVYLAPPSEVAEQLFQAYVVQQLPNGQFRGTQIDFGRLGLLAFGDIVVQVPTDRPPVKRRWSLDPELQNLPPGSQPLPGIYLQPLDLTQKALQLAREYAAVETPADDSDKKQARLKNLDAGLKELDKMLKSETIRYRSATEHTPDLKVRYNEARKRGLIGEAIDLLKKSGDLTKEYGPDQTPQMVLQMIALELAVGRLEDAAADIATFREEFDKAAGKTDSRRLDEIMIPLRHLEYLKLCLEGDYATAGAEYVQLEGLHIGEPMRLPQFVENTPALKAVMLKLAAFWPAIPAFGAVDNPIGSFSWVSFSEIQYLNIRSAIYTRLERDASFFFRCGLLSLIDGDIDGAKLRFESVRRTAPPGWRPLEVVVPRAETYLRLIEAARKTPNAP